MDGLIRAQWLAPAGVQALTTTRQASGVSLPPFDRSNLGDHVGDDPAAVARNRALLVAAAALPSEPLWLRQVHGIQVIDVDALANGEVPEADAAITRRAGRVLAILTADCLPVLFAADDGSVLGAAHAGWRGLAAGVLEATIAAMRIDPSRIAAWIGPGIRQAAFEVGGEVRDMFVAQDARATEAFRASDRDGHLRCDLALLARKRLRHAGVVDIADCGLCTHDDARFHSHRRDGRGGRMATLLWR
jgi:polyphenol oxidase